MAAPAGLLVLSPSLRSDRSRVPGRCPCPLQDPRECRCCRRRWRGRAMRLIAGRIVPGRGCQLVNSDDQRDAADQANGPLPATGSAGAARAWQVRDGDRLAIGRDYDYPPRRGGVPGGQIGELTGLTGRDDTEPGQLTWR